MPWNEEQEDIYEDGFNFDDYAAQQVEESLARLEESFQKSQQLPNHQQQKGIQHQEPAAANSASDSAESSTAPVKRQRIEDRKGNDRTSTTSRRPAPQPAVDDFRVSHQGHVQGGSRLPAGEDEYEDGENMWGEMDLDQVENEAIVSSQRSQGRSAVPATIRGTANGSRIPSNEQHSINPLLVRGSKRYRDDSSGILNVDSNARRRASEQREAEISADRNRIEELERQLAMKDDELNRFKKENQTKLGEVSVLRANMNKTITEFSSVLRDKEEAIAKQKALNTEMKKVHEEQLARSETINAFKHTELATAAHWSSITASVARRRGGAGLSSSQRGHSHTQSQTVAAAVGLTTPTRRNRGFARNLGSGEGEIHKSGSDKDTRTRVNGEESPSSRKSALRQQRQNVLQSAAKAKTKIPTFPGFVNAFILPASQNKAKKPSTLTTPRSTSKSGKDDKVEPTIVVEPVDDDGAVFQDNGSAQEMEVEATHNEQACGPSSSLVVDQDDHPQVEHKILTGWDHPQYRYLWAVSTYSKQLSFVSSLILSHSSVPCSTNSPPSSHAIAHSSTLYRLLNASFPAQTPISLQEQYIVTTHMLLNILSQGTAIDAEDRFTYLLDKFDYEEHMELDDEEKLKQEEKEFWACHTVINEGISDVLNGVAYILCTMMAISLQSGMVQRLYDVFVLMRSICLHHPSMIHAILTGFSASQLLADVDRSQVVGKTPSQNASSPPVHLEIDVIKVIIICIRKSTVKVESREENKKGEWRLQGEEGEKLLKAILGMINVIADEVQSSNHYSSLCAHNLKRIIDEQGILASLLDHNSRSASTMRRTISILTTLSQHTLLWRSIAVCKIDKNLEVQRKANTFLFKSETPLLEILARQLVDGRLNMSAIESHAIHCDIVYLLSQLIIQHSDALVLVSESNSILAAVVKSLQIDTGLIWNDEGEELRAQGVQVADIVQRIYLDVRLLSRLYICPQRPTNLAKKLQSHESHLLLNGIKHCFILAISRIAFAPEPDWFDANSSHQLSTVNEIAADLLELILSPEEMENAWEMLNDEEEEQDKEEDEAPLPPPSPGAEQETVESQTQMDEDDQDVIIIS